jgi:hypothetical protein
MQCLPPFLRSALFDAVYHIQTSVSSDATYHIQTSVSFHATYHIQTSVSFHATYHIQTSVSIDATYLTQTSGAARCHLHDYHTPTTKETHVVGALVRNLSTAEFLRS